MKKLTAMLIIAIATTQGAAAASITNKETNAQTIIITEGSDKKELNINASETVEFCENGCFVTMPNGDRQALTGTETIEISNGITSFK